MNKKMFNPEWKDLPRGFLTTTRKGKQVYRIKLNEDEIIARLEEGKNKIALDILTNRNGEIAIQKGFKNGRPWRAVSFYAWAREEGKKDGVQTTNSR